MQTYLFVDLGVYGRQFLHAASEAARDTHTPLTAIVREWESPSFSKDAFRRDDDLCRRFHIDVFAVRDTSDATWVRDLVERRAGAVVAGFSRILSSSVRDSFGLMVNVHPSILPCYRGPAPTYWVLKNREQRTGFTIHRLTSDVDGGEILFQEELAIPPRASVDTLDELVGRAAARHLGSMIYGVTGRARWNPVYVDAGKVYERCERWASRPV